MTTAGALSVLPGGTSNAAATRARRVEKSPDCAGSEGEYPRNPEPRNRRTSAPDRRDMFRNGTETAPLWYGPRLRAPFVAQFIGQVLIEEEPVRAPGGYKKSGVDLALVIDRRV
jgi:hypothetical protein